jgi:pyruvate dehydrogenase E1 component
MQAPDVSTSTQLSGFVNTRGVFGLQESADTAKDLKIMSMNKWNISHQGQHVELGKCFHKLLIVYIVNTYSTFRHC